MFSSREYIEDRLLAEKIHNEDKQALANSKNIQSLEEKASQALIEKLMAESSEDKDYEKIYRINQEYELAIKSLESAKAESRPIPSAPSATNASQHMAKAQHTFTHSEISLIESHYEKVPESLRKLMDAVISDERISLGLIPNPVFIKGEGEIYDRDTINKLLEEKASATAPLNRNLTFTKKDVIPCNTLIISMLHLLNIIQNKELTPITAKNKLSSLHKITTRKRIPANLVHLIERNYMSFQDKHKLLFDTICRDPMSNEIMDDPVLLPDGYVYDRSTALAYLELSGGKCPLNSKVTFQKEDITSCYFVISVLDELKKSIESKLLETEFKFRARP